jgi:hypothetical protein
MGKAYSTRGDKRNAYSILEGKTKRKRTLGRPRHSWEDNINMDLLQIGLGDMDWIDLALSRNKWRALVNTIMNLRIPQSVGKFLSS